MNEKSDKRMQVNCHGGNILPRTRPNREINRKQLKSKVPNNDNKAKWSCYRSYNYMPLLSLGGGDN